MANRKQIEKFIIDEIFKLTKDVNDTHRYTALFKSLSNKEFEELMLKFKNGDILNIIVPIDVQKSKISLENNLKLAKAHGEPMVSYTVYGSSDTEPNRMSLNKNLKYILPIRRARQTLDKGVSVSADSKHIDQSTGQVTGTSRSSRISNTEANILDSMELLNATKEFIQYRGDAETSNLLITSIKKYGVASNEVIDRYAERTRSSETFKVYLNAMHLNIDL